MTTIIVDYGSGNLRSAAKAFERAAADGGIATEIKVSGDADAVRGAERIVLPGVGAFADCRRGLAAVSGMEEALDEAVRRKGRPFFGICVGMQLMAERGREFTVTEGLGWLSGEVVAITPDDPELKVPHMGWNELELHGEHPVLAGIANGTHAYFVHSYAISGAARGDVLATVSYGGALNALVARDNLVGTQFHPEKSQAAGLAMIANFLRWRP
ncbi:MAG TPA: imidazole glycerol phosphate synthase subunit HisH [Stellaceae bacterium]|jgi:glutamine amidotransferase|nr:imidazole glycerol phosphate synthase subunit HisH [Stellaceae bacterium]